ncbi:hypothetical protein IFR05_004371 [Cadophora sp. M221]|nr:hypothetical protein IFR05_004371 [Cadophora sp. M221]
MSSQNHIPKSFKEVADSNLWMKIRDYGVGKDQEEVTTPHPKYSTRFESASQTPSDHSSSPRGHHATGRDGRPSHTTGTLRDAIHASHRPPQNREPAAPEYLPSPASSTGDIRISRVTHITEAWQNGGQNGRPYSNEGQKTVPLGRNLPEPQQQVLAWNNSQQPLITFPAQYDPAGNGFPRIHPNLPQAAPDSPSSIQYRFTLVPIIVNGEVFPCWYPSPEINSATVSQAESPSQGSDIQVLDPPVPRNFQPTNMVLEKIGAALMTPYGQRQLEFKQNYQGDPNSEVNRRQVHQLPDAHNCTLWLWNIPATLHVSEVFDQIDTGAVQCCHIVPPNEDYHTCAAKLAFMAPEAAAKFKEKAESEGGIWLGGRKLMVRYNRDGNLRNDTQQSRVLIIEGPKELMTLQYWESYFAKICVFQWDRVLEIPCQDPEKRVLQFSFVRLDGQAQACMGAIRTQSEFVGVFRAGFALDQCGNPAVRDFEKKCRRLY